MNVIAIGGGARKGDNRDVPIFPSGVVNQTQLENAVSKAIRKLGKEAIRVRYSLDSDWSGDPAIYFRIVLTDAAAREHVLFDVTQRIEAVLLDALRPRENLGLIPYFSYRSKSEQATSDDPEWV
jgi:hypothetical protein